MPPKACFRGHICFFGAFLGVDTLRITDVSARFFTFLTFFAMMITSRSSSCVQTTQNGEVDETIFYIQKGGNEK